MIKSRVLVLGIKVVHLDLGLLTSVDNSANNFVIDANFWAAKNKIVNAQADEIRHVRELKVTFVELVELAIGLLTRQSTFHIFELIFVVISDNFCGNFKEYDL